jgi:hypothetical protein
MSSSGVLPSSESLLGPKIRVIGTNPNLRSPLLRKEARLRTLDLPATDAPATHHAPVSTDPAAKPEISARCPPDLTAVPRAGRAPSASACESYRELVTEALARGRCSATPAQ